MDKFLNNYNQKNPDMWLSYTIIGLKALGEILKKAFSFKSCFDNDFYINPTI